MTARNITSRIRVTLLILTSMILFHRPTDVFLLYRYKIYYKIRKNPLFLRLGIKLFYPLKSKEYRQLLFFYHQHKWQELGEHLDFIDETERDFWFYRSKQIVSRQNKTISPFLLATNELLSKIDLSSNENFLKESYNNEIDSKIFMSTTGGSNMAMIVHSINNKLDLITKVQNIKSKKSMNSLEYNFYNKIQKEFVSLDQITPQLIYSQTEKDYFILTLKYTHGRKPQLMDIMIVKDAISKIQKINYVQLKNTLGHKVISFMLLEKNPLISFSKKSAKTQVKKITSNANGRLNDRKFLDDIEFLKSKKVEKLYQKINLIKHLRLTHGDFGGHNSIVNADGILVIYDWSEYTLDIPGKDLMFFILSFTFDFKTVITEVYQFLESENISNLDLITCILTLNYIEYLVKSTAGVRIQENWDLAIDYLKNNPLCN